MNIIEIGANDGSDSYNYSKIAKKLWCFEPVPYLNKQLRERFKDYSNVEIIEMAVSDFNGEAKFNIALDGQSSSLHNLSEFTIKNNLIKINSEIKVKVIRMDTFIDDKKIEIIDYFHCDAQGNDLTILKSFGDKLSIIKKGVIEVSVTNDLYQNNNTMDNAIQFLSDNGFSIVNLDELQLYKSNDGYDCNLHFYNKKIRTNLI